MQTQSVSCTGGLSERQRRNTVVVSTRPALPALWWPRLPTPSHPHVRPYTLLQPSTGNTRPFTSPIFPTVRFFTFDRSQNLNLVSHHLS